MPFFSDARDFTIKSAQMNDVAGDYTANYTTATANNSDSNNVYLGSTVRKGNNETRNVTIGNGGGGSFSFGNNESFGAGMPVNATPELLQLLAQMRMPGFSAAQAAPQPFAAAPQSAAPPSAVSTALRIMQDVPEHLWTRDMITALEACVAYIQGALEKAAKA